MYPQAQSAVSPTYDLSATPVPQPMGIASRVQSLQKAVGETCSLAWEVKSALGITSPENEAAAKTQPASLADVITDLERQLNRAAAHLQDAIRHLNS